MQTDVREGAVTANHLWSYQRPQETQEEQRRELVYIRGVALRQVVVAALYPDVLHVPAVVAGGGSAGAERTGEQVLDVLQLQALGLRETTQDEEEAQHHQASVQEERPWKSQSQAVTGCRRILDKRAKQVCRYPDR